MIDDNDECLCDVLFICWVLRMVLKVCWIVSFCSGLFILVEVGLFDGCVVMMYWVVVEDFCECYFVVCFEFDCIYVKDGNVYMLVGVMVSMDLGFVFFEEDFGVELVCCIV